jgi:hypothetical protein
MAQECILKKRKRVIKNLKTEVMKKFTILSYIGLTLMISLASGCSVNKRVYMKGYNLEWNSGVPKNETEETEIAQIAAEEPAELSPETPAVATLSASVAEDPELVVPDREWSIVEAPQSPEVSVAKTEVIKKESRKHVVRSFVKKELDAVSRVPDERPHVLSIVSLVLGILSLVAYYGAFPLGLAAIITGAIALRRINNDSSTYRGRGMAWAGIICGIIAIAAVLTILVLV